MREQVIQKNIMKWLKENSFYHFKTITCNRAGIADIIGCTPQGYFFAIEVKRPGGIVSELQQYNIREVTARKGLAFVAYSVDDVVRQLSSYAVRRTATNKFDNTKL